MKLPVPVCDSSLIDGFDLIRAEYDIPRSFPHDVLAEAFEASAPTPVPSAPEPFVAIDPAGAADLDQAVHIERRGAGYRVRYAIADPAHFIEPGGAIDREARKRGVTIYMPDRRTPLHPRVLSEQRASLLPDGVARPALVWTHQLDSDAIVVSSTLRREAVEVAEAISYRQAQHRIDSSEGGTLGLLRDVGRLRSEVERSRGGVSLNLPTQEVRRSGTGYHLDFETTLPVERWNAQISLMTGMVAAEVMSAAGIGVLRTLPNPRLEDLESLRARAAALDVDWPVDLSYPEFIRGLIPTRPAETALLYAAARTLRGAGYQHLEQGEAPQEHGAIRSLYAHVTAPLRRLVDRFSNEILHSLLNDDPIPSWAAESLDELPARMQHARALQANIDRAVIDYFETIILQGSIGGEFTGVVVKRVPGKPTGSVQLTDPAVVAKVELPHSVETGDMIEVRLRSVDPGARTVDFVMV